MPFIDATAGDRKRLRSGSPPRSSRPLFKYARQTYHGADCSTTNTLNSSSSVQSELVAGVRQKVKNRMSAIRSIFSHHSRSNNSSEFPKPNPEMMFDSLDVGHSLGPSANNPPGTALMSIDMQSGAARNACHASLSSVISYVQQDVTPLRNEMPGFPATPPATPPTRGNSPSALSRQISELLQPTIFDQTVVHKQSGKSRPSVRLTQNLWNGLDLWSPSLSTPSSGNSDRNAVASDTSGRTALLDETTFTSCLMSHKAFKLNHPQPYEPQDKHHHIFNPDQPNAPQKLTIRTVEATTSAKVFLETHFNALFYGYSPRELRRRKLEKKLNQLDMPNDLRRQARTLWQQHESNRLRFRRVSCSQQSTSQWFNLSRYEMIKVLGKGSFGVVRLVKEKSSALSNNEHPRPHAWRFSRSRMAQNSPLSMNDPAAIQHYRGEGEANSGKIYAIKVIRKSTMLRNSQEGHLRAERNFLVSAEGSQWIIPLFAAFQDHNCLYLVMEFCIGGDFLSYLIRENILSEDTTRWYVAEMILCVEEAHRMRWIHRDVKPDNFLIGADGHLKISDFGLAFDGEWEHDQGYYTRQRQLLAHKLGLQLSGDRQDQEESQVQTANQCIANIMTQAIPKTNVVKQSLAEDPPPGESLLQWRNRAQRRRLARSVVGTSQYMAPEVIRGEQYDGRCD